MVQPMAKLSARSIQTISTPGMYGDGNGLYLRVGPTGGRSWIVRTVVHGRRRDLGIGSASLVSLAEARDVAHQMRKVARSGGDPDQLRKRETLTFAEAASRVHANLRSTWRSERHGAIWFTSLERYAFPVFGHRPIETIGHADILRALEPIWATKHDTAKRIKQRIGSVFDWAKAAGHYPHENPVTALKRALPVVKAPAVHRPALAWADVPSFMRRLKEREGVSARALEFIVLTAVRSGEARGARWDEFEGAVWTIPAERMKTGEAHRVPLSPHALAVLERVRGLDQNLVFPSPSRTAIGSPKVLSDTVFKALMDRMGATGITTHGFRSSFRDWCSERAFADREIAEAALSHKLGSKVERAYARSDLFNRRLKLMEHWGHFAAGEFGQVFHLARQ
jgi:integrase